MSNITTLIYQFINQTLGKLDWQPGSVIRELVAEPVVRLSEEAVNRVNDIYNQLNIEMLLNDPENNAEAINELYNTLGLGEVSGSRSTGSIQIFTSSKDTIQMPAGTTFYYEDTAVALTATYTLTASASKDNSSEVQLSPVGANAFTCILPVTSTVNGTNLSEGLDLTWPALSPDIYAVKVYTAITGGQGATTATQKINKIRQQLFPQGVSACESILRCINDNSPDLAVDCTVAHTTPTGVAGVFVKPTAAPQTWDITSKVTAIAGESNRYCVQIPATGVYKVKAVGENKLESVVRDGRLLVVTYASTQAQPNEVVVTVFGYPTLVDVQKILDNYTENTGLRLDVYAPRPLILEVQIPIKGTTNDTVYDQIIGAVNNSLLNTTTLGDSTVDPLLAANGITRRGQGTYTIKDIVTFETRSTLSTAAVGTFLTGAAPYAIYTTLDKIELANG